MKAVVTNNKIYRSWVYGLHLLFLLGILGFTQPDPPASTEIRRISYAKRADGKGIVIRLHAKSPLNAFSEPKISSDNNIEVKLFNAQLSSKHRFDSPYEPIVDVDVNENSGHLTFKFELDDNAQVKTAVYPDQSSDDLLVGITVLKSDDNQAIAGNMGSADRGKKLELPMDKVSSRPVEAVKTPETDTRKAKTSSGSAKSKKPEPKSNPPVKTVNLTEKGKDDEVVSHSNHEMPSLRHAALPAEDLAGRWVLDTVVIDAGHGGHDPGARANGLNEKDVNLAVALKLGSYLERFLKLNVVYTRTDDSFVELEERGSIANRAGAKLFISIHANSAPYSKKVSGTETYILGMGRAEKALEVMDRENSVIKLEDNPDQYEAFYQNSILNTLALSANMKMSEKLAAGIEKQFADRARRKSRGVKQARLIVLWAASMPAVLVELGYLTNRLESMYLNSEQGQDYLASAIFRAVRDFKMEYEKGLHQNNPSARQVSVTNPNG